MQRCVDPLHEGHLRTQCCWHLVGVAHERRNGPTLQERTLRDETTSSTGRAVNENIVRDTAYDLGLELPGHCNVG